MKVQKWLLVCALLLPAFCLADCPPQDVSLDVRTNIVPMGPSYGGVQTDMIEGTYTVTMNTTYSMGPVNMECNKAIVYALTKGHPDSWVWVVTEGESQTLVLEDESYSGDPITVNCFLPEGSDTTGDNTGGATLTFTGPATYNVSLDGITDTIMLYSSPGTWKNEVRKCNETFWDLSSNYSMGPGLSCNKALLWVSTFGNPDGWVWVLSATEGQVSLSTMEVNYPGSHVTNMALFLPEGSTNVGDNSGSVTVTASATNCCHLIGEVLPTESSTWGEVKATYR